MMFKKSQAALEFLTTYAWAFLVILVMVGALAYFGILKPSAILPTRCTMAAEFGCQDYVIFWESQGVGATDGTEGEFHLGLKNNIGEPLATDDYELTTEDGTIISCTEPGTIASWGTAAVQTLDWTVCDFVAAGFAQDDKAKVVIKITYHLAKSDPTYQRIAEGEVFTSVI